MLDKECMNIDTVQEKLNTVIQYQQAGKLQEAEVICNELLKNNSENDVAFYLLGLISYQNSKPDLAIEYIKKAITINPDEYYFKDLGNIYFDCNKLDESIICYEKFINLNRDDAEVYLNLGKAFSLKNRIDEAIHCYKKVLELEPSFTGIYFDLGLAYQNKREFNEAIRCYQLSLNYERNSIAAHYNLGLSYYELHKLDDAVSYFKKTLELTPNYIDVYYSLGHTYYCIGDLNNTINSYKMAIKLDPCHKKSYVMLGMALYDIGEIEESIKYYQKVLEIDPDYLEAYVCLSQALLLKGDFEKGWEYFEKRLYIPRKELRFSTLSKPAWDGSTIDNKTIYIYYEQGFGDTIQFARYLPLLQQKCSKIIFRPQIELETLFEQNNLGYKIINNSVLDNNLEYDVHASLMSLAYLFKTKIDNIPFSEGYLKADPQKVAFYKENYFNNKDFKIGLVWQAKNIFYRDLIRSISDINIFKDVTHIPGVKIYSLQKGNGEKQLDNLANEMEIINLGKTFKDFSDTAAVIENMDLIITIDTSVAHLSGALGKPAWVLLPYVSEFRWLMDREDTPWYKNMRLFRQNISGNWDYVISNVANSLKTKLS